MPQDLQAATERLAQYVQSLKQNPKLLLVDDSEDDLLLLEKKIKATGLDLETESTTCGAVALSSLEQFKFDLMFLDIRMDPINGIDILRSMPEENRTTPVVIMSGFDNWPLVDEAIRLGAWLHLRKPIQLEQLKKMLSRVKL